MEIIRNLSGIQKGLLAGLALGIVAVYFCLCLSAVGVIPVSLPGVSGPVAKGPTATAVSPTATSMSGIPDEPSPAATGELAGEDSTAQAVVAATEEAEEVAAATEESDMVEIEVSPVAATFEIEILGTPEERASLPPSTGEVGGGTAEAGANVSPGVRGLPTREATPATGERMIALAESATSEPFKKPTPTFTPVIAVLPTLPPTMSLRDAAEAISQPASDAMEPVAESVEVVMVNPGAGSPTPQWVWQGVEVERTPGSKTGASAAVLAVRVFGIPDREVEVREISSGLGTTLVTGRKAQYGDFSDDVTGLPPATYVVKPKDINAEVRVTLEKGDFVLVEFALRPPDGWSPEAAEETLSVPLAQGTVVVQKPEMPAPTKAAVVAPVQPAPTQTPLPAVQPVATTAPSGIVADPAATRSAEAGWTWQGIVYEHRKNTGDPVGIIAVRVVDVPDRKVFVKELGGSWETTLVTGKKPEYGKFSDDVGGLGPGTYTIKPMDIDSEVSVTLARGDSVLVEFALRPAPGWTPGATTAPPVQTPQSVGQVSTPAQSSQVIQATAPAAPTQETGWTWQGIIYEQRTKTGDPVSIIAVRVVGVPDRKVFIKEKGGSWETTLVTGDKPQYGSFSADVGGLPPGAYTIKPMDIDSEVSVTLERGDFVLVEFALRPAPGWTPGATMQPAQATAASQFVQPAQPPVQDVQPAAPASTQDSGWAWQGIEYERKSGTETGNVSGILAVRVVGVPDRKVFIRELSGGWETTLTTGQKPEYGDFADAVGGLAAGVYVVKPMDIDSEVSVKLDRGDFALVEFALRPVPGAGPAGGQQTTGGGGAAPTPTLVPGWVWEGRVVEQKPSLQTGNAVGRLVVRGIALPDWKVTVREVSGGWTTTVQLERHPEYGNFSGVLEGLGAGTYMVELVDNVGTPAQVTMGQGDFVLLEFFPRPASQSGATQ